ncbi:MAG: hypothetical protein ACM65M_19195 [Microcoleus sp.]
MTLVKAIESGFGVGSGSDVGADDDFVADGDDDAIGAIEDDDFELGDDYDDED